jgi:hypothetical protein
MSSLIKQDYHDVNWIVGSDVECSYYPQAIRYPIVQQQPVNIPQGMYFAPWNHYLDVLQEEITGGWVMYLDDDDEFTNEKSLRRIANACVDEDTMVVWRVKIFDHMIVPSHSFGQRITAGDFSGIGFCFHSKYLPVEWGYLSYGDFRVAQQLLKKGLKIKWIDMILTQTQNGAHNGK